MAELRTYRRKRDFAKTPEPEGADGGRSGKKPPAGLYCIQKHAARQLHYDLRLELDGVLVSWAVPKGRASTRRTSGSPCTWRTTPSSTAASRARSPRASTAAAR